MSGCLKMTITRLLIAYSVWAIPYVSSMSQELALVIVCMQIREPNHKQVTFTEGKPAEKCWNAS